MHPSASRSMVLLVAFSASASGAVARFGARARGAPAVRRVVRRGAVTDASASAETAAPAGPTDVKNILECKRDMSDIVSLCKRRGFVYPSSEIYSGFAGFFDYGPLGVELRNNIKKAWWQDMVQRRDDVVGLDSSIIASPRIWEASGHLAGFSDPMVDCKETKQRFRADQLFYSKVADAAGEHVGYVSLLEGADMEAVAAKAAASLLKKAKRTGPAQLSPLRDFTEADPAEYELIPSPATGEPGSLTAPRDFNLMFQTSVGAMTDGSSVAYLRPETAQGIFTNFKNVVSSSRVKVPFGIAQIGKVRRHETRRSQAGALASAGMRGPCAQPCPCLCRGPCASQRPRPASPVPTRPLTSAPAPAPALPERARRPSATRSRRATSSSARASSSRWSSSTSSGRATSRPSGGPRTVSGSSGGSRGTSGSELIQTC